MLLFSLGNYSPCSFFTTIHCQAKTLRRAGGTKAITVTSWWSFVNRGHVCTWKHHNENNLKLFLFLGGLSVNIYMFLKLSLFSCYLRHFSSSSQPVKPYILAYADVNPLRTLKDKHHPSTWIAEIIILFYSKKEKKNTEHWKWSSWAGTFLITMLFIKRKAFSCLQ